MTGPDFSPNLLGINLTTLLAGLFGGLVRSLLMGNRLTTGQAIMTMIAGALTANYMTPVVLIYLLKWGFMPEGMASAESTAGFIVGVTGMMICEGLIKGAQRWRDGGAPPPAAGPGSAASS